ncbi:MAG TPA: hypothetical protein DD827_06325 [Gammaproteobacteria bacterium]|nr:hypothetical protein [Gammaproteobacteria bacterium]
MNARNKLTDTVTQFNLKPIAALIMLAASSPTFALSSSGLLSQIKGQIVLQQNGENTVVVQNTPIEIGDVVITFENSTAQLIIDDCKVDIGPNSLFTAKAFGNCQQAQTSVVAIDPSYMPKTVDLTPQRTKTRKAIKKANRDVGRLFDEPGVLTPRGGWIFEPAFSFSHSTATKVAIEGLSVLPALAVGLIDVSEVQRNILTGTGAFRYGVSNRIEIEGKVPYTFRQENNRRREVGVGVSGDEVNGTEGNGIGDIELSLRYQITSVKPKKPYYLANLRIKSRTGLDPFQVERRQVVNQEDGNVIGEELLAQPTGSGFWAVQPSITMVYPTEPSVLFGNLSYLFNLERDLGGTTGVIDPGDAIGFNFGVGFSVNPRTSFSLGYDHNIVLKTKTPNSGIDATFDTLQIGSLLIGISHVTKSNRNLSVSLGIGVTDQSTDVNLGIKTPFNLF